MHSKFSVTQKILKKNTKKREFCRKNTSQQLMNVWWARLHDHRHVDRTIKQKHEQVKEYKHEKTPSSTIRLAIYS